jgi:penicillin-binding protein 1A
MQEPPTTVLTPPVPAAAPAGPRVELPTGKPKVKWLRLIFILLGLSVLALVSTVFGMMMAVASDLPQLENKAEFKRAENSVVEAAGIRRGKKPQELAKLTNNQNRILVKAGDISPNIKNAVIAVEDRRFYEHGGVDYRGIARALLQDIGRRRAAQGGSTVTQQFVKNALAAQGNRSVFQKLREAALAYHLERKWSKQKVLTQYLNSVYFGNGAYGVEAAVRSYFGSGDRGTGAASSDGAVTVGDDSSADDFDARAARSATPAQAALLAGMIASPSLYDPVQHPAAAKRRRDGALARMRDQHYIGEAEYRDAVDDALPTEREIHPPQPDSKEPYFTSWLTQQLVDRYRATAVFAGGLRVRATLDPDLQGAAEQAISRRLAGVGPSASLVAIDNRTGEVRAMVGGSDFQRRPFNVATNGHRQPGSAFKPFILIRALEDGVSPEATFTSQQKLFPVPGSKREKFVVKNYEDSYSGVASLRAATAKSDNSVFAELGLRVGTRRIASLAERMGIRTNVSTNPAMTLGGLKQGVTPLELASAYSTIANRGVRVSGTLAASPGGPVAIQKVEGAGRDEENAKRAERVFPAAVGDTARQLLEGVVQGGTGKAAQIGEFAAGKTGTTEDYGDAWFVGFNKELTVAVWVGYPDKLRYMKTEYHGGPVAGGTYPAEIWRDFMTSWIAIRDARAPKRDREGDGEDGQPLTPVPVTPAAPGEGAPGPSKEPGAGAPPSGDKRRATPAPRQPPAPSGPAPTPTPTPSPGPPPAGNGGGGTGGQGGAAAPG